MRQEREELEQEERNEREERRLVMQERREAQLRSRMLDRACTCLSAGGGNVYTTWSDGSLVAVKVLDGSVRWRKAGNPHGVVGNSRWVNASFDQPYALVASENSVTAYNGVDGRELWTAAHVTAQSMSVAQGVFVTSKDGYIQRLDDKTGRLSLIHI